MLLKSKKAFTLIELLVVVLIIGILSAIALPQYQVAVEKTKATNLLTLLDSIAKAEEIYYLANGRYTDQIDNLDVQLEYVQKKNHNARMVYQLHNGYWIALYAGTYHQIGGGVEVVAITRFFNHPAHTNETAGGTACYGVGTIGQQVCKSMGVKRFTYSGGCGYFGTDMHTADFCRGGNIE